MKKFQKIVSLVLIVFLISACGNDGIQRSRNIEEPAVYSALINDLLEVPFSFLNSDPIIIINSTYYETTEDDRLFNELKSLNKDTLEDFKSVNQVSQVLDLPLTVNKPYEYTALPNDETDWIEFLQKYPNAISITRFSKIGFNKKLNQALVYMRLDCGSECGHAIIYLLVRKGDTWKVEKWVRLWIS